ncbi:MAG: hypothetical protein HXX14_14670 [Bacteroidetes bacterium]|nr:hypothetical protein [Bacteroidota bacterium]
MMSSPLLDVAISLIFIYLLVALMVTGVTEFIFTFRKTKSKLLKSAIQNLFYDDHWQNMSTKIIDSPFIQVLKKKSDSFPSFIPPKVFVNALLDLVTDGKPTIDAINAYLAKDKDSAFPRWLKMELAQCNQSVETLKKNLELLFDNAMDRVTSWYTRNAKLWSLSIALVICAGMNIDSVDIVRYFFDHPDKATEMADSGAQFVRDNRLDTLNIVSGDNIIVSYKLTSISKDTLKPVQKDKKQSVLTTSKQSALKSVKLSDSVKQAFNAGAEPLRVATIKLQQQPIPLGWKQFIVKFNKACFCNDTTSIHSVNASSSQVSNVKNLSQKKCWSNILGLLLLKVIGILASAAAASVGAPFWFDLLGKLTPLRKKQTAPSTPIVQS